MKNESTLLNLSSDPIKFRATSVKSYYDPANDGTDTDDQNTSNATNPSDEIGHDLSENAADRISENSPDNQLELTASIEPIIRGRGRPRKHSNEVELIFFNICFIFNASESTDLTDSTDLNTQKLAESTANFNLFSYTTSRQKEISKLLKKKYLNLLIMLKFFLMHVFSIFVSWMK